MQSRKFLRVASPVVIVSLLLSYAAPACFFRGPATVSAEEDGETVYYLLTDHLGSVDAVLDEKGNIVEHRDYLPYGAERVSELIPDSTKTAHGFTGKEVDDETGLNYYSARYYDSLTGRFMQQDPLLLGFDRMNIAQRNAFLAEPQNLNMYAYVQNNPLKYTDSTGQYKEDVHYDLTYFLAMLAGLSFNQSKTIAFHNQETDNNPFTAPYNPVATVEYHFISRDEALKRLGTGILESSLKSFGRALHSFQDTYSHGDYTPLTHIRVGDTPDLTHMEPEKAIQMAEATFMLLRGMNQKINGLGDCSQTDYEAESKRFWADTKTNVSNYLKLEDKAESDIKNWADQSKIKNIVGEKITSK